MKKRNKNCLDLTSELRQAISAFDSSKCSAIVTKALQQDTDPSVIMKCLSESLASFKAEDVWLPDLFEIARTTEGSVQMLRERIEKSPAKKRHTKRIVIGTIQGDIHDLGKNLVISMLRSSGFDLVDLGTNVSIEKFIRSVEELKPDVLGISSMITPPREGIREVIRRLNQLGVRKNIKIIVGGHSITSSWAKLIGADGYAENAIEAVNLVKRLFGLK